MPFPGPHPHTYSLAPAPAPHLDTLSGNLRCQAPSSRPKRGPRKEEEIHTETEGREGRKGQEKPAAHCSKEGSFQGGSFPEAVVEEGQGGERGTGAGSDRPRENPTCRDPQFLGQPCFREAAGCLLKENIDGGRAEPGMQASHREASLSRSTHWLLHTHPLLPPPHTHTHTHTHTPLACAEPSAGMPAFSPVKVLPPSKAQLRLQGPRKAFLGSSVG